MILCFDDFELDTDRYELRYQQQLLSIEPLVFDLLAYFAQHPHQVFSRDDLIESVWSGRIVSDATVSTCIKNVRKALSDSGDQQRYLKTIRGRGFCFTAEVSQTHPQVQQQTPGASVNPLKITTTPALLILPFRVLSDDPSLSHLSESLATDLSTILTRVPLLRLSAQFGTYGEHAIAPSARAMHEQFGVDYVLEGNLQKLNDQIRINAHLCDAKTGFRLWAEQFTINDSANDALDASVIALIGKLEPQLNRAIYNKVRARTDEPNARELFLEASGMLALKGWNHESFSSAAELLRHSRALDSEFALSPAYLALIMGLGERVGLMSNREEAKAEALEAAEHALYLDNMDSTVLGLAGCALADIGQVDRAVPILRNAIELNPANAQAWAALGSACLVQRKIDEALKYLNHGIKISPLDSRLSIWGAMLTIALILAEDIDTARLQGELACQRNDRTYPPRIALAAVHLIAKTHELALSTLNEAYRIKPDLSPLQVTSLVGMRLGNALLELKAKASGAS